MAMYQSEDGETYSDITTMPTGVYVINEEKTYCKTSSGETVTGKIKTVNGIHGILGLNKGDKCYLYFDKKTPENVTELIASLNAKTTTPDFNVAAITDEGAYATLDGMYGGTTYYWRGVATTNHVIFANKCWRIVRINGDKTVRLIYNGDVLENNTCFGNGSNANSIAVSSQLYNSSYSQSNYVGWTYSGTIQRPTLSIDSSTGLTTGGTPSIAKSQTETWYNSNIGNNIMYSSKIADGKFCNDRNVGTGYSWGINPSSTFYYAARSRRDSASPTFSCINKDDVYTLKVGAITADEVMFAGGKAANNTSYYLYNGQIYLTMSPYYWFSNGYACIFIVREDGYLDSTRVTFRHGLRPVINLKADVTFSSGNGLKDSPYIVSN